MTPDFALSLSFSGIALMQRAATAGGPKRGWYKLGEVALDVDDLSGALAILREEAVSSPDMDGPEVKLILPNEQIKYLSVPMQGDDPVVAVETALADATPYATDELYYDWRAQDGLLQIAAVARETLQEAESFALDNRFVPLGFVAVPPEGSFDGEPFFGPTEAALTQLAPGVTVMGDVDAIDVIDGAPARPDPIVVESQTVTELPEGLEPAAVTEASGPAVAEPDPAPALKEAILAETSLESAADQSNLTQAADAEPTTAPAPEISAPTIPAGAIDAPSVPSVEAVDEAPKMAFASLRAERSTPGGVVSGAAPIDPTAHGQAPKLDGASAQDATATAPKAKKSVAATKEKPISGSFAAAMKARAAQSLAAPDDVEAPTAAAPLAETAAPDKVTNVLARAQSGLGRGIGFVSRRTSALRAARAAKSTKPAETPRQGGAAATLTASNKMDEAERMTVFGARGKTKNQIGGKPRFLGLMLTAVLLLVLLGVAAFASIFVDEGLSRFLPNRQATQDTDTALSQPSVPQVTGEEATPAPELALPVTEPVDPTAPETATLAPGLPATTAPTLTAPDALGLTRPLGAEALSPEEAEARYAATGIWQRAPVPPAELRQGILDDLYIASIDRDVVQQDAVALPAPGGFVADTAIEDPGLPPRADERFQFTDDGFIRPTPEGTLVPGGYTLFSGSPGIEPPVRGGLAALATPDAQTPGTTETAPAAATTTDTPRVADPSLRGLRPLLRPDDLAELNERANLGGLSLAELGLKRPQARPDRIVQAAVAPETPDVEAEAEADTAPVSALAVANSAAPKARPNNIARIVRQAERESAQDEATRVAAVAPRTVSPSIPSSASVTRAATQENAINLRRVNLIGVYGKPSDRRALIRLSNGRFKKVKVGDRLDGGRILAISDDQLRYQKGGRNVTLDLPQS
ncbi:hypothetical protein ACS3SW_06670 [Roseobacteraceae bacterium S113]